MGMRECQGCREHLAESEFFKDGRRSDGLHSKCRACYYDGKVCTICGEPKTAADFYASRNRPEAKCKACIVASRRAFRKERGEHVNAQRRARRAEQGPGARRDADLRYRFNISLADAMAMLERQGGCGICGSPEPGTKRWWHVDHDHSCCPEAARSCGKCIRGLLCHRCNLLLGQARDSRDVLLAAVAYLGGE